MEEFHEVMGQPIEVEYSEDIIFLRRDLIEEEVRELLDELRTVWRDWAKSGEVFPDSKERLLKEMADLQYVLSGLAVTFGLPLQEAFLRVHKSNMSKLGDDGKPVYREDGKVMKGSNYKPADLSDLVA